ncbi:MAG TPA: hypothetical protein DEP23_11805 [Ruminococcaceae bacterium]|nr:hypothetical protein [Oscillospiraceae bacterium]
MEDIYTLFNTDHPPTHRGHSLSVSDIVEITDNSNNYLRGFFYCDSAGFENIGFNPARTHKPDNLLRVVMVEPGKPAYEAEIQDSLKSLQRTVAGHLEATYPFGGNLVVVCNEEGKIIELPENREIYGDIYCGNFFIVGDNHEGDFCSLTDEQTAAMLERFSEPEFFGDEEMDSGIQMS